MAIQLAAWAVYAIYAAIAAAFAYGSIAYSKRAAKKAAADQQGFQITRFGTDEPIPIVYGTREVAPVIIYKGVRTISNHGAQNNALFMVAVWCVGEVEAIEQLWLDDITPDNYTGLTYEHRLGTDSQTPPAWFVDGAPDDVSDVPCRGLAVTYIKCQDRKERDRYPRGEPGLKARIKGRRVFDPRDGSRIGSSNPALILRDYLLSPFFGKGLTTAELDDASFVAMATFCDQSVIDQSGSRPMMTCNAIVDTSETLFNNVDDLRESMRGYLIDRGGRLALKIERDEAPVLHLGVDDLADSIKVAAVGKGDRFNRVIIRYPEATARYTTQEAVFPLPGSALDDEWLAEDYGVRQEKTFSFTSIDNYAEALQMAEVLARTSRDGLMVKTTAKPTAMRLEQLDVITLDSQLRGWEAKPFRVMKARLEADGTTELELREHQDSGYPWSSKPNAPAFPDTSLGSPFEVPAVTGLFFELTPESLSFARLSWDDVADRYEVELLDSDSNRLTGATTDDRHYLVQQGVGATLARVRAVGPFAFGQWASIAVNVGVPTEPDSVTVTASANAVTLEPVMGGGLPAGVEFEFWFRGTSPTGQRVLVARSGRHTQGGLQPLTGYHFSVRARNILGVSDWVEVAATTAAGGASNEELRQDLDDLAGVVAAGQADLDAAMDELGAAVSGLDDAVGEIGEGTASGILSMVRAARAERGGVTSAASVRRAEQAIADETSARASAIETVQASIASEASTRSAQVTSLQQAIADESSARASAITGVQAEIDGEASTRSAQVTSLQQAVTDEASARSSADAALQAAVSANGEQLAAATLQLEVISDDVDGLTARAFLGVNALGQVTGIYINGSSSESVIKLLANQLQIVRPSDGKAVFRFDTARQEAVVEGAIQQIGSAYMTLSSPVPFGSSNQFVEWYGPRSLNADGTVKMSDVTESRALSYKKTDGSQYYGGSLSAGVLNSAGNFNLSSANWNSSDWISVVHAGSNGRQKTIIVSAFVCHGAASGAGGDGNQYQGNVTASYPTRTATFRFRLYRGATVVATWTRTVSSTATFFPYIPGDPWPPAAPGTTVVSHYFSIGSQTVTDNSTLTGDIEYRLVIDAQSGDHYAISTGRASIRIAEE